MRRQAAELVFQLAHGVLELGHHLDHVGGDVDRLHAVDQRPLDRLLDPPGGVGAEAAAVLGVEAFDGFEQADVSFLDQVGKGAGRG